MHWNMIFSDFAVCISLSFPRNRTNKRKVYKICKYSVCVYIYIYIYILKEFTHVITEAWRVQNLQRKPTDWRPREELPFESRDGLML